MSAEEKQVKPTNVIVRVAIVVFAINVALNIFVWLMRRYAPDMLPELLRGEAAVPAPEDDILVKPDTSEYLTIT